LQFLQEALSDLNALLAQYATLLQASKAGPVAQMLTDAVEATAATVDVAYLTAEIPRAVQQALEGVERVATIVRAMKAFSHPGSADKTPVDLNKALDSTITFRTAAGKGTTFIIRLPLLPADD
jgi:signal transduction histidine kinase